LTTIQPVPGSAANLTRPDDFVVVSHRVELRRSGTFRRVIGVVVVLALLVGGALAGWHLLGPKPPGVLYRSNEGHFAARFPHAPDTMTKRYSESGLSVALTGAVDAASISMVLSAVIRGGIPAAATPAFLRGVVAGLQSGTVTPAGQSTSTFRGMPATTAYYTTPDAVDISAMVFVSSGRGYVLVARSGETFLRLAKSFRELP
jgi:hypothetical protein